MTDNTCVIKETEQFQRGIKRGDGMEKKWQLWASLPGGAVVKTPPANEMQVPPLSWKEPLEEEMATPCSILAWEIPGQRSLAGYPP